MNEPEKERILGMISEGIIRPEEAASLLAALSEEPSRQAIDKPDAEKAKPKAAATDKPKEPLMEVQMQRADGSTYTVQVPPNLVPLFWNIAKVAIKESARNAAQETWAGFKHIVRRNVRDMSTNVRNRVTTFTQGRPPEQDHSDLEEGLDRFEARRQILQMVQNGRITAGDAGRLIEQLDALDLYMKARPSLPPAR